MPQVRLVLAQSLLGTAGLGGGRVRVRVRVAISVRVRVRVQSQLWTAGYLTDQMRRNLITT